METFVDTHATVDGNAWDQRLLSVPSGHFFQSTGFGELCRSMLGEEPLYVRVENRGRVLGQLLCLQGYWFRDRVAPLRRPVVRAWRRFAPARRWQYGPVLFDTPDAVSVTRALIRTAAADAAVSLGSPAIHGRPGGFGAETAIAGECRFSMRREATLLLDIAAPLDEIWERLSPDAKRNVRRARREGVTVHRVDSDQALRQYYAVQLENRRRRGLTTRPFTLLTRMHRLSCCHGFVSALDGTPVSAQGAVVWNGVVTLMGCSVSDFSLKLGLHGNDLTQWHVIEWAHSIGARVVDWVGYTLNPSPRQDGINRFKAKWGGQLLTYNTYYRIHPWLKWGMRWYRGYRTGDLASQ